MADFPPVGEIKCDLFLGRFSPFHNGHLKIVKQMTKNPIVTIVKGKATGDDKVKNPFPVELQEKWVKMCVPNMTVTVSPNGFLPGILGFFRKQGKEITQIFCGEDRIETYKKAINDANNKMEEQYHYHVKFIETERVTSATKVRETIKNNDIDAFKKLVPEKLWDEFDTMAKYIPTKVQESLLKELSLFLLVNNQENLSPLQFSMIMESVVDTKRVGLTHFDKMKPIEFLDFVKFAKTTLKGVIPKTTTVKLKLDGLNLKFGKDVNGKIFIEGARTGAVFDEGTFINYATSKGAEGEILLRSQHYEDMLSFFKKAPFMDALPNDSKIDCEMFYNPLGNEEDDTIKYVEIKYNKAKMGSFMTIAPYSCIKASTGEPHPNSTKILNDLFDESNDKVKIVRADLAISKEIDISALIDPLETLLNDDTYNILASRKHADKEQKANLTAILQAAKDELRSYLMFHPHIDGLDRLVDDPEDNEGTVWHLPNGRFKMTTDSFQATKKKV